MGFWREAFPFLFPAQPEPEVEPEPVVLEEPPAPELPTVPSKEGVYRIEGVWDISPAGVQRPDYEAYFEIQCRAGSFKRGDMAWFTAEQVQVLSKRFILIPVVE